ncbi:MAG TPA: type IX secretion system protein PorQ [Cytophagaceae bacterium]|jgi:hypothetical protein
MKKLFVCCFFLVIQQSFAQIGGKNTFQFTRIAGNAQPAGLGGINVSVRDVNMINQNPALITDSMSRTLSMTYIPYFADIDRFNLNYVVSTKRLGPLAIGLDYFNYGTIQATDDAGNNEGEFKARDYILSAATSRTIDNFSLGLTTKFAGSHIGTYNAFALLADLGGVFKHPTRDFTVGLVFKNIGIPLKKYHSDAEMNLPFDIQLGTSYKLEHMPFRFSLSAHNLHRFNIVYSDPNKKGVLDANGEEIKEKVSFGEKVGRHFVVGGEFLLGKHIAIRFGYNYLRRRELRIETKAGPAGMSFGAMVKIKSFEIAFTRAFYNPGAGTNFLTLNTNFNTLLKRRS